MSIIKAETLNSRIYAGGAHGNKSMAFGRAVLKSANVNDVVEMLEVSIGIKVVGVKLATESGLGAGAKVTIKCGDKELTTAIDMASAGATASIACVPFNISEKTKLTATISGATATGDIHVMPEYVAEGY